MRESDVTFICSACEEVGFFNVFFFLLGNNDAKGGAVCLTGTLTREDGFNVFKSKLSALFTSAACFPVAPSFSCFKDFSRDEYWRRWKQQKQHSCQKHWYLRFKRAKYKVFIKAGIVEFNLIPLTVNQYSNYHKRSRQCTWSLNRRGSCEV